MRFAMRLDRAAGTGRNASAATPEFAKDSPNSTLELGSFPPFSRRALLAKVENVLISYRGAKAQVPLGVESRRLSGYGRCLKFCLVKGSTRDE
jgi:hypothetical protein